MIPSKKLSALPSITHGFFGREGGVSKGIYSSLNCRADENDSKENVAENKKRVLAKLGVPETGLQMLAQIHSDKVGVLENAGIISPAPQADGLVTAEKNIALGILTADCAPVLFADSQAEIIGACHAGWRGAKTGIAEKTLEAMEKLGAKRKNIIAAIGPCIGPDSYEVSVEFYENFLSDLPENKIFFTSGKPGHFLFNLPGYIKFRLEKSGLGSVEWLGKDTLLEPNGFFSFRRNTLAGMKNYGCQISVIAMKENMKI